MRVILYTGKGGVGKTTTAAATAVVLARRGRRTLVASTDSAHSLGDVFGTRLGPEPRSLAPGLAGVEVDAREETERHWGAIRDYLFRVFRYQGIEDVVADELALLPGAEELTTLLAVETFARGGHYDVVVVDCAPTDVALRLLTLPEVARGVLRWLLQMQRALTAVATPLARNLVAIPLPGSEVFRDAEALLYRKLRRLRAFVTSPRATTRLVVTPERMAIDEALRTHTDLALFELPCDAVVLNRMLPGEVEQEEWLRGWLQRQAECRAQVEALFAPLPVLLGPLQEDEVVGLPRLARQGRALFGDRAPDRRLSTGAPVRFEAAGKGARVHIPVPHASAEDLQVARVDANLIVGTGSRRRCLPLPRHLQRLELAGARLQEGALVVSLAPEGPA